MAAPNPFAFDAQQDANAINIGAAANLNAQDRPNKSLHDHQAKATLIDERLKALAPPSGQVVADAHNTEYGKWPVQLVGPSIHDKKYQILRRHVNPRGVIEGVGVVTAGPEYLDYIDEKRKMMLKADFEAWVCKSIDLSTPEKRDYWYKTIPWLLERKSALLKATQDVIAKAAEINMVGPKSEDDYLFIYGVRNGLIKLPMGNPWEPAIVNTRNFYEGLFSVTRMFPWMINDRDNAYKKTIPSTPHVFATPLNMVRAQGKVSHLPDLDRAQLDSMNAQLFRVHNGGANPVPINL